MKIKSIGLWLIILLAFVSCQKSPQDTFESLPGINVPADRFNTTIKLLDDPNSANSHKNGDLLLIRIMNFSNEVVVFPENYGIKLFIKKDGSWIEFPNNSYNEGGIFYLPPKDSYPLGLMASIVPDIPKLDSSTTVRIVIVGHKENDSSKQLGAYIDVLIRP